MADESEPDLFADARQAPPRALTRLSPLVRRLIAPNASPFTFNGTCTYIVGSGAVAVVDPGPGDDSHLAAILAAVEGESDRDDSRHPHPPRPQRACGPAAGGDRRADRRRRAVRAERRRRGRPRFLARPRLCARRGPRATASGSTGDGFTLEAVATPGHCANHLCFALA